MFIVNNMPIRKNNKTYSVGAKFPYSDTDKSLLDKNYIIEVKEEPTISKKETVKKERPKEKVQVQNKTINSKNKLGE